MSKFKKHSKGVDSWDYVNIFQTLQSLFPGEGEAAFKQTRVKQYLLTLTAICGKKLDNVKLLEMVRFCFEKMAHACTINICFD